MPLNTLFFLSAESSDWLAEGITALIAGLGTVFIVLILISVVISFFKYMKPKEIVHVHEEAKINAVVEPEEVVIEDEQDDLELIAVITAAIAASMNTTTDKLQVKSFRRVNSRRQLNR